MTQTEIAVANLNLNLDTAIIAALSADGALPREALRAAAAQWESVLPLFFDRIERFIHDPVAREDDAPLLFFAVHLCGQMREPRAFGPLLRLLSIAPEHVCLVLGDATTTTLHQIVASVFDGDSRPLHDLILNERIEPFVREAAFKGLAFLTGEGRIAREETVAFLYRCDDEMQPRGEDIPWIGWQAVVAYLGLGELRERVRAAFGDGRIELGYMEFEDFEDDLAWGCAGRVGPHPAGDKFGYFGDTIDVLSAWDGFSEAYLRKRAEARLREGALDWGELAALEEKLEQMEEEEGQRPFYEPFAPHVNPLRHVGRNDPCPCGSGKKHKKCCLK